jgi:hypothetical protein
MQLAQFTDRLLVEGGCIRRFMKIEVTAKHLVGSFTRKHHFDTHGLYHTGK